jgi:hypothetical protein
MLHLEMLSVLHPHHHILLGQYFNKFMYATYSIQRLLSYFSGFIMLSEWYFQLNNHCPYSWQVILIYGTFYFLLRTFRNTFVMVYFLLKFQLQKERISQTICTTNLFVNSTTI